MMPTWQDDTCRPRKRGWLWSGTGVLGAVVERARHVRLPRHDMMPAWQDDTCRPRNGCWVMSARMKPNSFTYKELKMYIYAKNNEWKTYFTRFIISISYYFSRASILNTIPRQTRDSSSLHQELLSQLRRNEREATQPTVAREKIEKFQYLTLN